MSPFHKWIYDHAHFHLSRVHIRAFTTHMASINPLHDHEFSTNIGIRRVNVGLLQVLWLENDSPLVSYMSKTKKQWTVLWFCNPSFVVQGAVKLVYPYVAGSLWSCSCQSRWKQWFVGRPKALARPALEPTYNNLGGWKRGICKQKPQKSSGW